MRHPASVLALEQDVCGGCSLKLAAKKWGQKAEVMDLEKGEWLNHRSQRKNDTRKKFLRHWQGDWQIPRPRVVEQWGKGRSLQGEMPLES